MTGDATGLETHDVVADLAVPDENVLELADVVQTDPDVVLSATKVSKAFGGLVAVREVDLEIRRGSIVSLIGPNGAGKTTFFNVIAGILDPTAGHVAFRGRMMI